MFTGEPDVERDEVTKRMDFYGPPVNRVRSLSATLPLLRHAIN